MWQISEKYATFIPVYICRMKTNIMEAAWNLYLALGLMAITDDRLT
jgi:hypothetical protein